MHARRIAVLAATTGLLMACGAAPASGDNGCGTSTSPCHGAGNTLPSGWTVTEVQVSDGRKVTCITWNNPGAAFPNPGLSCDWNVR